MKYKCPCCGFYTFYERAGGTDIICKVCFWQDDYLQLMDESCRGGANNVSLAEARENYRKFGASEERFMKNVREPLESELPPDFFIQSGRLGFSRWKAADLDLAEAIWGEPEVTRFICASGVFSREDIAARLDKEIENNEKYSVQYWPVFELSTGELVGCCGLRPHDAAGYELGFHLRSKFWRRGYGFEAARTVIDYAFDVLNAGRLFAGHHPENAASRALLLRLGFEYKGDEFYEPTGLCHPGYELKKAIVMG